MNHQSPIPEIRYRGCIVYYKSYMIESNRIVHKWFFYRITKMTGMDSGEYYIGFAKKCRCGQPPRGLTCICKPSSVKNNGIESGDIFFNKKSYYQELGQPSFNDVSKWISEYPIIVGYETHDTGKNSDKKRLIWKRPTKYVKASQSPTIDVKSQDGSQSTTQPFISSSTTSGIDSSRSRVTPIKILKNQMNALAPIFKPKEETTNVFSYESGLIIPKIWSNITCEEWNRCASKEFKSRSWIHSNSNHICLSHENIVPSMPPIHPALLDLLIINNNST